MKMLTHTFTFQDEKRKLKLFPDPTCFKDHVKHFLDKTQPWYAIKPLHGIITQCQKNSDDTVCYNEQLYTAVMPIVINGMQVSLDYPLYVMFKEKKHGRKGRKSKSIMLTNYGFIVIANAHAVISVYYKNNSRYDTPRQCFETAWYLTRTRLDAEEYAANGVKVSLLDIKRHTTETWTVMPDWRTIASEELIPCVRYFRRSWNRDETYWEQQLNDLKLLRTVQSI